MKVDPTSFGCAGSHLPPEEFHAILSEFWGNDQARKIQKQLVVIDVRNHHEYLLGRFEHCGNSAVDPNTKHFSQWPELFADACKDDLKNKKVLMYCTGIFFVNNNQPC
jgi:predicted sulfurtransferase